MAEAPEGNSEPDAGKGGADVVPALGAPHPHREGFVTGSGALREVAAFVLDSENGSFAGVPSHMLQSFPYGSRTTP